MEFNMLENNSINAIAIIPARGGSKRIPRKNIKPFLGNPVIKFSIEAAIRSNCFRDIMVSTDDPEIKELSLSYGASVPFYRSDKNSNDLAGTAEVLLEVLTEYSVRGINYEYLCCLYPAAPFINDVIVKNAMNLLVDSTADAIIPVVKFSYPIQRALTIVEGELKMLHSENYSTRSQDFSPTYHDCGLFYCLRCESFMNKKTIFMDHTIPLLLSEFEVQDIDTESDWDIAEKKFLFLRHLK